MNIYDKLDAARKSIRANAIKKDATNAYSGYDYFTPEKIESLVTEACTEQKLICLTSLKADAYGIFQVLQLVNLEDTNEQLIFELRTAEADMKATNGAQKMGGTDTYSERYIKMKVFTIKDNSLDFDSQDNRAKPATMYRTGKATHPDQFGYKDPKHKDVGRDDAEHDMGETIEKI